MNTIKKLNIAVLTLFCLFLCGCQRQEELFLLQSTEDIAEENNEFPVESTSPVSIAVYVCGQVVNPGVVYLAESARVVDAVTAAGGLTEDADAEYINLAARVTDGEKIYIPDLEEGAILRKQEEEMKSGYVNINTADKERLMTLPGIGESKAQDIIDYRNEHGAFSKKEDLMKISGIKESLYEKISDKIIIE